MLPPRGCFCAHQTSVRNIPSVDTFCLNSQLEIGVIFNPNTSSEASGFLSIETGPAALSPFCHVSGGAQ